MAIDVTIEAIIKHIGKEIKFLQPVYEAIANSLEADATHIKVEFLHDETLEGHIPKITGFSIEDDGDGFTEKNRIAFTQLWTDNKASLGCKGSGRFTWLSVFDSIQIESDVFIEQKKIKIPFTREFTKECINVEDFNVIRNKTKIVFGDVTTKFNGKREKSNDSRFEADLDKIQSSIQEYLIVKLFLLKNAGRKFEILLTMDNKIKIINEGNIPNLSSESFNINSEISKDSYSFTLYYYIYKDKQNSKKVYYCANARATKKINDDELGFSCALPNNDSFIMLLCSDYFNDKDNDSRNDFTALANLKQASLIYPLLLSTITAEMKKHMQAIILRLYPEIKEYNKKAEEDAINAVPYLASIIKEDKDLVKSKDSIITKAKKEFADRKASTQRKFEKLLIDKRISTEELHKAMTEVSDIALAELGEYVLYRNSIIRALDASIKDIDKNEAFIHNIFMPMKTSASDIENDKHMLSNLWLLDDKFMTYSYAASDKTIKQIEEDIYQKNDQYKINKRPDLTIFYNTINGKKDVIVVEFKGPNADKIEKNKSLTEITDNIAIVKKNISDINSIWSYIITSIDDDFQMTIENQDVFKELFSNDFDGKIYYRYIQKNNAHVFILDIKSIISDAFARNKTFLDILKKK